MITVQYENTYIKNYGKETFSSDQLAIMGGFYPK